MKTYFTSESVTEGHPDKVCDCIADAVLDELLKQDPYTHCACEVTAMTDAVHIFGEITSGADVSYEDIARNVIRDIGYTQPGYGFDAKTCRIDVDIHKQSPDINMGVEKENRCDNGAGDQGMMFGYACRETESYMPLPIELAHRLTKQLTKVRKDGLMPYLLPDGKAQVTVEYRNNVPSRIDTVVVSAQHNDDVTMNRLRNDILYLVIFEALPENMIDENTKYLINPTGRFHLGGPAADSGLTGRKLIVDTYGGYGRHGGGAFSGKDPSKTDRSGAYMARYLAKNVVAAGFANRCEVQLSYAIGVAQPVSVNVDTFSSAIIPEEEIRDLIVRTVDLRPEAIIDTLSLRTPFYRRTSAYGHFGFNTSHLPWEKTDLAEQWFRMMR